MSDVIPDDPVSRSTFPTIKRYTRATMEAACAKFNTTPEAFRLSVLKRVECELDEYLRSPLEELHPDDEDALRGLLEVVRLAVSDD